MSDEAVRAAFAVVARYQGASKTVQHFSVGTGPFALVAEFADGRRMVKADGFESAADAETFMTYANLAAPPAREKMVELMREQGAIVDPTPFTQFYVVELVPVVSDRLAGLEQIFKRPDTP